MKITRDYRRGKLGVEVTIQSLDGITHSHVAEHEALMGKMLDEIRKVVTDTLVELERANGQVPGLHPEGR